MEASLNNKAVFVEFYGIPASGKSTISHYMANRLRDEGLDVCEPTYAVTNIRFKFLRGFIKLMELIRYKNKNPQNYKRLMNIIYDNGHGGIEGVSHASNIAHKLNMYKLAKKGNYIIFDEGIVQSAVSLSLDNRGNYNNRAERNEHDLNSLCSGNRNIRIYVKTSPDIAKERMIKREKHFSRIEKLNLRERMNALKTNYKACEDISCVKLVLDGLKDIDENVKSCINYINKME